MAFNDAALVVMANAIDAVITHAQLYSAATNAAGTTNTIGTRVAINGTVDADGDWTVTNIAFTGLSADRPCTASATSPPPRGVPSTASRC